MLRTLPLCLSLLLFASTSSARAESGVPASVPGPPAAAEASTPEEQELLLLHELLLLRSEHMRDRPDAYEARLREALDTPFPRALPRARALKAFILWAQGDAAAAREQQELAGLVTRWTIIGPFPNEGMSGFRDGGPLERSALDVEAPLLGRGGVVTWQRDVPLSDGMWLRLHERIQPAESAWMYAVADLRSPISRPARVLVGASGAWRLWHNGEPVAGREERHLAIPGSEEVDVHLIGGRNRLVFQIAVEDEAPMLSVMVVRPDGMALPALEQVAVEGDDFTPLRPLGVVPAPRSTAQVLHDAMVAAAGEREGEEGLSALQLARLAALSHYDASRDPGEPWRAWQDAALKARGELDAAALRGLARVARTDWERLALLADAVERMPEDVPLRVARVRALQNAMGHDRLVEAAEALRELRAQGVDTEALRLLEAQQAWQSEYYYRALELLMDGLDEENVSWERIARALHYARELRRDDLVPELVRRSHARSRNSVRSARDLVDVLRAFGDARGIARVLDELLLLGPNDPRVPLLHAEQARVDGDAEEALHWVELALERCPGCAEVHEERGRLLLEAGQRQAARAAFERALEFAPQRATLRGYVARLDEVAEPALERAWRADDASLRALRDALDSPDESLTWLVDQRLVQVFGNGLSRSWNQRAAVAHTRSGVDQLRSFSLTYTPGAEEVEIRSLRLLRPDGSVREGFDSSDRALTSGPQAIYFDVRSRMVQVRGMEPGDIIVLEYRISEIGERNLFEDYFGDVFFVEGEHGRAFVRHGTLMPTGRTLHANGDTLGIGSWRRETVEEGELHIFEARDVPAVRWERMSAGGSERHRMLSVSTWGDWDGLADWYWNLIRHQLVRSPALEAQVHALTEGLEDTRDIVEAIHEYVVRTTRYVSLAFGVHGFRPYRTTEAFERRFGDCKDSASLMKVMLDVAGVHSETVLIRTRDLGRVEAYPPSLHVFNHMILYIPELDLWLDGTAGHSGLDELPGMDQGGSALIVHDGEGGTFLEVPALPAEASRTEQRVRVDLRSTPARAHFESVWTGNFAPWLRRAYENPDRRSERFAESLARVYPGARVDSVDFEGLEDIRRPVHASWETSGGTWTSDEAGLRRLRLPPGRTSTLAERLLTGSERRSTLVLEHRWIQDEHWEFVLPEGARELALPEAGEINAPWGSASLEVEALDDLLRVRMQIVMDAFRVPADDYPSFREFVEQVDELFRQEISWREGEES